MLWVIGLNYSIPSCKELVFSLKPSFSLLLKKENMKRHIKSVRTGSNPFHFIPTKISHFFKSPFTFLHKEEKAEYKTLSKSCVLTYCNFALKRMHFIGKSSAHGARYIILLRNNLVLYMRTGLSLRLFPAFKWTAAQDLFFEMCKTGKGHSFGCFFIPFLFAWHIEGTARPDLISLKVIPLDICYRFLKLDSEI